MFEKMGLLIDYAGKSIIMQWIHMIMIKRRKRLIESLSIDGVSCRLPIEVLNFACIDVSILCLLLSKVLPDNYAENNIQLLSPVKCRKKKTDFKE